MIKHTYDNSDDYRVTQEIIYYKIKLKKSRIENIYGMNSTV